MRTNFFIFILMMAAMPAKSVSIHWSSKKPSTQFYYIDMLDKVYQSGNKVNITDEFKQQYPLENLNGLVLKTIYFIVATDTLFSYIQRLDENGGPLHDDLVFRLDDSYAQDWFYDPIFELSAPRFHSDVLIHFDGYDRKNRQFINRKPYGIVFNTGIKWTENKIWSELNPLYVRFLGRSRLGGAVVGTLDHKRRPFVSTDGVVKSLHGSIYRPSNFKVHAIILEFEDPQDNGDFKSHTEEIVVIKADDGLAPTFFMANNLCISKGYKRAIGKTTKWNQGIITNPDRWLDGFKDFKILKPSLWTDQLFLDEAVCVK